MQLSMRQCEERFSRLGVSGLQVLHKGRLFLRQLHLVDSVSQVDRRTHMRTRQACALLVLTNTQAREHMRAHAQTQTYLVVQVVEGINSRSVGRLRCERRQQLVQLCWRLAIYLVGTWSVRVRARARLATNGVRRFALQSLQRTDARTHGRARRH